MSISRHLADIADLALGGGTVGQFRQGLFDILARAVPYDGIYLLAADSEMRVAPGDVVARGWDAREVAASVPVASRELAERALESYAAPERPGGLEVREHLGARGLEGLLFYDHFIRQPAMGRVWLRVWRNRHGGFSLAVGRKASSSAKFARFMQELESMIPMIQAGEALFRPAAGRDDRLLARVSAMGLSSRELEVATYLVRGLTNKEIAALLGVSTFTIRNQLSSVFRKAGVTTRAELVYRWLTDDADEAR